MTNLFKPYDEYQIDCHHSRDKIIAIMKSRIHISEKTFNQILHPTVQKRYFGEFNYPNRFLIRSSSNPMTWGLNAGVITEIDVEEDNDITSLKFKVKNMGLKMIFVVLFAGLLLLILIGFLTLNIDTFGLLGLAILFPFGILGLGYLIQNSILMDQKKYFKKILSC